jgi:hypothetical protein
VNRRMVHVQQRRCSFLHRPDIEGGLPSLVCLLACLLACCLAQLKRNPPPHRPGSTPPPPLRCPAPGSGSGPSLCGVPGTGARTEVTGRIGEPGWGRAGKGRWVGGGEEARPGRRGGGVGELAFSLCLWLWRSSAVCVWVGPWGLRGACVFCCDGAWFGCR